jgi:6-phosphogluconolactonase
MTGPGRHIVVVEDGAALAEAAAERLIERIEANAGRIAICMTGGSSPKRLYELLATEPYCSEIPWDRVHWFIGDDRFVPSSDPLNNMNMARGAFLDSCAPRANIHPIKTDAASPDEAAALYARELQSFYGIDRLNHNKPLFDLVLLGVGPDGHVASLFPGYPAIAVTDRWVVGVPEAHVTPFVPRVSLTLPVLASCREMLFLMSGADKRPILTRVLSGEDLPANRATSEEETVWLCDKTALPDDYRG